MKVLLAPDVTEVAMKADDFCTVAPGTLLTLYGEPCHEGEEEIWLHGCGRALLALDDAGWSTVGVVAEMSDAVLRERMQKAVYVTQTMEALGEGETVGLAPESEGAWGMCSVFAAVATADLRDIDRRLGAVAAGSVFGVRNTGTGSRLVHRVSREPVQKTVS
jgi:hypothetical protein